MSNSKKEKILTLESLRGIAALCVALYHYPSTSFLFFPNGHYAVYFFFILSGFVISLNYSDKIITFKDLINFQIKRFYRLYPLHFFTLFLVLFVQICKYFFISDGSLDYLSNNSHWYSFKNFIGNLFLIQAVFNDFYIFSWNGVSWSISTEFYTYFIFGFLFFIVKKYKFLIIIAFSYIIYNNDFFNGTRYLNNLFYLCIYNFSLGYFCYCLYKIINFRLNNIVTILFLIILLIVKVNYQSIFYQNKEFFFFLIILFVALLNKNNFFFKLLHLKFLVFLGSISYSFYLIHQITIYLFIQFCKFVIKINFIKNIDGYVINTGNMYYDTLIHISYISLSILFAFFLHKYIELRYIKK